MCYRVVGVRGVMGGAVCVIGVKCALCECGALGVCVISVLLVLGVLSALLVLCVHVVVLLLSVLYFVTLRWLLPTAPNARNPTSCSTCKKICKQIRCDECYSTRIFHKTKTSRIWRPPKASLARIYLKIRAITWAF